MFAGNIGAAQDFPTILAAAEKLKNYRKIHWIILGDGRKRLWVEQKIKKLKLDETVHLMGRRPIESMPCYFAGADALLVTLKSEYIFKLTIPAKIQSYLACGKPVAAALDGEGARVIQESGGGMTAPAGNPEALADIILQLYHMPESDRKKMGLLGRDYFEIHFKRDKLLDRLNAWMKEEVNQ